MLQLSVFVLPVKMSGRNGILYWYTLCPKKNCGPNFGDNFVKS